MIKVLITDKLAQEGIDLLNSMDGVEAVVKTGIDKDELASIIGEHDGLIIRSGTKVTPEVLTNSGKLKAIARAGVGVDNIDIPEATRKGIIVMNTPGGNTLSAAEHTMALILSMSRNVVPACNSLKGGAWDRKKYMGNQLNSKVLGLIGLGRIGMAVADMAKGFNMKILGYDPFAAPPDAEKAGIEVSENVERIFREADFISVHVPRNEQTLNMIDAEQIRMMKPTARLVNCARGGIINEDALYDALAENRIAGAALDVFPKEPPENTRFSEFEHCIATPHLGASTEEAQIEVAVEAARILVDAIKGGPVRNALNAPSTSGAAPTIVTQYGKLARRIGSVVSTIAPGHIKEAQVQYRGSIAEQTIESVTLSFAIGLLQKHFDMPLNMVNTPVLAKSVFGGTLLRIIEIDGFNIEVTPQGSVLVIFNDDKPGVIGSVGTVCGKHGINICTMGVGQKPAEQKAMLAVSLDQEPNAEAIEELGRLDFVNEIYVCKLD
ncbi:MAG: phosphoglycerate dehydrogenase [Planctomycetota bacterium]|jgi:D-3-phosphoglycerate dehydrogenase